MPKHKINGQKVIILDTIRKDGCNCGNRATSKLMYKVKDKDLNIHKINEVELEY